MLSRAEIRVERWGSIILFPPDKIKMEARKYQLLVKGIDRCIK